MKILVVENDVDKAAAIEAVISEELGSDDFELDRARTINEGVVKLARERFDLVIVDLMLPQTGGGRDVDATQQWCELIENALSGRTASWIVMSAHSDVVHEARGSFARHNVAVLDYDDSRSWKSNLAQKVRHHFRTRALDFVIVCALVKERKGFAQASCTIGASEVVHGLDCQRVSIGDLRGMIVVQPSPGMISAAIVASKALSAFRPRAIAMSGICGGRAGETELGALIVPDLSWNYQSGKFVDGTLKADLLQVVVPPSVKAELSQLADAETSRRMREGLMHSELMNAPIDVKPMVSGSQVVADETVSATIAGQGRKVAGIDMEVASVLFAGHDFFDGGGIYFAAKTVVDLANPHKDDRYHEYGCALSARFVVAALSRLLSRSAEL
jgi:adenosylhomocysteine nucleosidase